MGAGSRASAARADYPRLAMIVVWFRWRSALEKAPNKNAPLGRAVIGRLADGDGGDPILCAGGVQLHQAQGIQRTACRIGAADLPAADLRGSNAQVRLW